MDEQIIILLVAIIGVLIKMEMGFRKIKRNDFSEFVKRNDLDGFIKRGEFDALKDRVSDYIVNKKADFSRLETKVNGMDKKLAVLGERTSDQEKQIESLFKWKNSK